MNSNNELRKIDSIADEFRYDVADRLLGGLVGVDANSAWHILKAKVLVGKGGGHETDQRALEHARRSLDLAPADTMARWVLSSCLISTGKEQGAIDLLLNIVSDLDESKAQHKMDVFGECDLDDWLLSACIRLADMLRVLGDLKGARGIWESAQWLMSEGARSGSYDMEAIEDIGNAIVNRANQGLEDDPSGSELLRRLSRLHARSAADDRRRRLGRPQDPWRDS